MSTETTEKSIRSIFNAKEYRADSMSMKRVYDGSPLIDWDTLEREHHEFISTQAEADSAEEKVQPDLT